MKKLLFLTLTVLLLCGCGGSDNEDWQTATPDLIAGGWTTEVNGTSKYFYFEKDGSGFYTQKKGAEVTKGYLFNYTISGNALVIKQLGLNDPFTLLFLFSGRKLKIEAGDESGTYKRETK